MADQNLRVVIGAVDKTGKAFRSVASGLRRVKNSLFNVKTALTALAAGAGIREFATQIDDLAKKSRMLGLTVNELQRLQFAASQTGVSSEQLSKGLERFSRSISEASTGIGTGMRSFEALGITVTKADGSLRPTSELLEETADRLKSIEDPADRVRIAFDLFGRSGAGLVNTLMEGSEGLKALGNEFDSVTLQLTGAQAKAVEEANDLFDKMGQTLKSVGQQITATLMPVLADLSRFLIINVLKALNYAVAGIRDFMNAFVEMSNELFETDLKPFKFGQQLNEDLDRIIFNFENAHKGVEKLENGMVKMTITQGNAAQGFERTTKEIKEQTEAVETLADRLDDLAGRSFDRLGDAFADIITGASSTRNAFRSLANSILNDLARIYSQQFISKPLMQAFASAMTPSYSLGSSPTTYGGEVRAMGGHVGANKPYMVGERGAELFVPGASGTIIPNNQLGGGGVTVNQTINLSAGVSQTVRAEVLGMMPQIADAAKGAVLDAKRRGGSFGAAFGA
jgi:uncharacterized phage infection (PIP) family protein YhgE